MPHMLVRGANLHYEIHGSGGPWVALTPGGRRPLDVIRSFANRFAAAGYRVLIHDRRNCGASDVVIEGDEPEYRIWADDLHEMLERLSALPVILGGSSSGCRLSLTLALASPRSVRALMLWRVTGGPFPSRHLAEVYYGQYIRAAQSGGMQAVCALGHFLNLTAARPAARDQLLRIDREQFIRVMSNWRETFVRSADLPVIGATEAQLRSIRIPTFLVPGNDRKHSREVGENAQRLIPGSELHVLFARNEEVDLVAPEIWDAKEEQMAGLFLAFLMRRDLGPRS